MSCRRLISDWLLLKMCDTYSSEVKKSTMFSELSTISSKPGVEACVLYSFTAAAELRSCCAGSVSSISAMRASLSEIC